jgi:PAS domain S-box-containing protein
MITDAAVDLPGPRIVYANRAAGEMTGHDPARLIGITPRNLQGPATDRQALDRIRHALAAAEPVSVELTNYRQDGTPFLVELDISPVLDQGQATHFIAVQTDITQRRRMEAAQRAAEEDLQAVVRFGPGLLYRARVTAAEIQLIGMYGDNCRIGALLGDQGDGRPAVAALLNEPDSARLLRAVAADSGRTDGTVDLPMARPGSPLRWLRHAVRVTQRAADFVEFVGYLSDVTVETEEQLRMQKLTTLITLGEMATGMAHELNQPLSSISFAAQNAALHLGRDSPDLKAIVGKITKIAAEAERATRLIEHMRVFARNERQHLTPISWHAALRDALEIMTPRLRGFHIVTELPADLPEVLGSPIPMEQMLINLLGNAMDAYEFGDVPVEAGRRVVIVSGAVADGMVVLRVADRAGGIPANVLPRVFEPFFTTKAPGKGTGLGLALCFGTVTEMGGTLTARNEAGGAVFEIRLPAAGAAAN